MDKARHRLAPTLHETTPEDPDMIAPVRQTPPEPISDVAIADWEDLLDAVKERLRLTVGKWLVSAPEPRVHARAGWVQSSVLECVAALDQLQNTLANELARHQLMKLELDAVTLALAQARAELVALREPATSSGPRGPTPAQD